MKSKLELQLNEWQDLRSRVQKIKGETNKEKEKTMLKEFYELVREYNKKYNMKFDYTIRPDGKV